MMENKLYVYMLIFVFSTFISSVSQVLLKKSAEKKYESRIKEYLNIYVISAYAIFFCATVITIMAYRYVPLSLGGAVEATGYLFVAFFDRVIFKQRSGKKKFIGLLLIVMGVVIICI